MVCQKLTETIFPAETFLHCERRHKNWIASNQLKKEQSLGTNSQYEIKYWS